MKQEIKKKWIKALKSGEYTRTKGALRIGNSFCPLGVLVDIYRKTQKKGKWVGHNLVISGKPSTLPFRSLIPDCVRKWAGIEEGHSMIRFGNSPSLAVSNDHGANFEQAAKLIEENL